MTIPTLVNNYQKQTYVTQLHKVYNEMQQALLQFLTDNNAVGLNESGLTNADLTLSVEPFLKNYFKVVNDCGDTPSPCFAQQYRSLSGTAITPGRSQTAKCVALASGASLCMGRFIGNADIGSGFIYVDTNGAKGPNVACRDYFRMFYYSDATVDGYHLTPACKRNGTACPEGGSVVAQRAYDFSAGCGDAGDPEDVDGIGKVIGDGWVMNY